MTADCPDGTLFLVIGESVLGKSGSVATNNLPLEIHNGSKEACLCTNPFSIEPPK